MFSSTQFDEISYISHKKLVQPGTGLSGTRRVEAGEAGGEPLSPGQFGPRQAPLRPSGSPHVVHGGRTGQRFQSLAPRLRWGGCAELKNEGPQGAPESPREAVSGPPGSGPSSRPWVDTCRWRGDAAGNTDRPLGASLTLCVISRKSKTFRMRPWKNNLSPPCSPQSHPSRFFPNHFHLGWVGRFHLR